MKKGSERLVKGVVGHYDLLGESQADLEGDGVFIFKPWMKLSILLQGTTSNLHHHNFQDETHNLHHLYRLVRRRIFIF